MLKRDRTKPRAGLPGNAAVASTRAESQISCSFSSRYIRDSEVITRGLPDRPAALVVLGKPALQVPCDDLIERRSLRPPTGITLLWRLSPRGGCCPLGWTLATGRDHGDTRLSEVPHSESGCRGHEGQRAVAVTGTRMA